MAMSDESNERREEQMSAGVLAGIIDRGRLGHGVWTGIASIMLNSSAVRPAPSTNAQRRTVRIADSLVVASVLMIK